MDIPATPNGNRKNVSNNNITSRLDLNYDSDNIIYVSEFPSAIHTAWESK